MDNKIVNAACPRILLTAGKSGSGKTMITCGILQALKERGMKISSFKCGPDYIDPMFHASVIGTRSRNLDTFFTDDETTRYLFARSAVQSDISVIEGVMGYYDGLGGVSVKGSAWDVARATDSPAILIVDARGMSVSLVPQIKGFLEYKPESRIRGVILNRMSGMLYPRMKELIERELPVKVLGYVPQTDDLKLESRHLGLVMPDEIEGLQEKLHQLAQTLEKTLDFDAMLELAGAASSITASGPDLKALTLEKSGKKPVIAVARDEAFCFFYADNLELLESLGGEIRWFSPLHDKCMPEADGLYLPGGYPELYAKELSGNAEMNASIREAVQGGLPTIAECGGFMYLQQEMEGMDEISYPMAGAIPGKCIRTKRLGRFGYITLTPEKAQMFGEDLGEVRGHEFHYFDSSECGEAFLAEKPEGTRSWKCIQGNETMIAGYPHLYWYSNPGVPARFLKACQKYHESRY